MPKLLLNIGKDGASSTVILNQDDGSVVTLDRVQAFNLNVDARFDGRPMMEVLMLSTDRQHEVVITTDYADALLKFHYEKQLAFLSDADVAALRELDAALDLSHASEFSLEMADALRKIINAIAVR